MAGQEDTSMGELAPSTSGLYVCSVCPSIPCVGPELILLERYLHDRHCSVAHAACAACVP